MSEENKKTVSKEAELKRTKAERDYYKSLSQKYADLVKEMLSRDC